MGCGCGGGRKLIDYEVTFKGGGTQTVTHEQGGLAAVRQLLAKSDSGGTYRAVPRAK